MMEIYLLVMLVFFLTPNLINGESTSACFNSSQKALMLQCGAGYMLRITKAFYGYSTSDSCSFQMGDCIYVEHEKYPCVGRNSCRINLPSGDHGQRIPSCNIESNYFQVDYECIPVETTQDICEHSLLTDQRGYISSPRYPNNYKEDMDCNVTIRVDSSQKLKVYVIDMELENNRNIGCDDWIYTYDSFSSITLCGRRSNEKLNMVIRENELTIQFKSNFATNQKGFWVFYEAYPPLPDKTTSKPTTIKSENSETAENLSNPSTSKVPILITSIKQTEGSSPPQKTEVKIFRTESHTTTEEKEELPFAAIVGGVIGTLSLVLTVLLILLAVKWWRERKMQRDKSQFLEVRNPAFRNSNEFPGAENYYNC
ncbi:hypothetical protein ScPMuIL_013149 [Solemya velum]